MKPFQIFGNLYFVGSAFVSSHVIDTGEGLILLDSGYPQCTYLITEGMRKLGLDPMNIKYILHSHGHYDHIGGTRALVELTGAKTVIGRHDVDYVTGKADLTWAKELGFAFYEAFEPDVILDDGDIFRLGKTEIRAVHTPGHTPGTMSYFFNVTDGNATYTAGMLGGAGMNSMRLSFLEKYGLSHEHRLAFPHSLERVRGIHVDIAIGNHPGDVNTAGKYELLKNGANENPFIDDTAWHQRLDYCLKQYNEMIVSGK